MFQPHAYATPTSQESTSRFPGVGFFTLIQGISTATYLTLPRLPNRPIGPEPFQYLFLRSSLMVRSTRFELVRSRALDPKSSVAAFTPAPQIVTAIYIHRAVSPITVSFASI